MNTKSVLYITYDGITDHIGQSQVAPYLLGLASKGHKITLLSAEKMERTAIIEKYTRIFAEGNVEWHYVPYHKMPPVISSLYDLFKIRQKAALLIRKNNIKVIHTRSYVPALLGLYFKRKKGLKFIFDMRDFWADAGKEIKRFDVENNKVHKAVYTFFKKKEKEFLEHADHIISLTEAGKRVMIQWKNEGMNITAPITVIPCCADFSVFDPAKLDDLKLRDFRNKLGIKENEFILNYLGSLGPSYLTDEMMDVFKALLIEKPNARFLVIANNDHHLAREAAIRKGIDISKIIIYKGEKEEIPYLIAQSDLSIFFIIPSFAKQACSPTKLAELFAMNIPVIANTKVGDLDQILNPDINNSSVVNAFSSEEYRSVLKNILTQMEQGNGHIRNSALKFSLTNGIELYDGVYKRLGAL